VTADHVHVVIVMSRSRVDDCAVNDNHSLTYILNNRQ